MALENKDYSFANTFPKVSCILPFTFNIQRNTENILDVIREFCKTTTEKASKPYGSFKQQLLSFVRRRSPANLSLQTIEIIHRHMSPPVCILTSNLHFYFHPLFDMPKFNPIKDITTTLHSTFSYMQRENITTLFFSINVLLLDLYLKACTNYWCSYEEIFSKRIFVNKCLFYLQTFCIFVCIQEQVETKYLNS